MGMIFSQRNLRIGGIALLLAVIIALLIFPRETEDVFQRCQDLYARGQYNACFKALTKELRKNPDWHECRELLVKAQLDGNDPLAALPNFLYLLEAGKEVDLKTSLLRRLSESDEEIQKKARLLLEERLAAQPELYKIRELLLQFELHTNNLQNTLSHLCALSLRGMSSRELEEQVARHFSDYSAWTEYMDQLQATNPQWSWPTRMKLLFAIENSDLEQACKVLDELLALGSPLDDLEVRTFILTMEHDLVTALAIAIKANQPAWVQYVLDQAEKMEPAELSNLLPQMLALLPDEPRLQVLSAFVLLPPSQGLDLLLSLEAQGYVPNEPEKYLKKKIRLLRQVQIFDFKYLKFLDEKYLPPASLINLAIECRQNNPRGLRELADYLDKLELQFNRMDTAMLRNIADFSGQAPKIIWQRPDSSQPQPVTLSLSPNGKWLICSYSSEKIVVNLATGEETNFDIVAGQWRWSPDSSKAAAITATTLNALVLNFDDSSGKIQGPSELRMPAGCSILGWLDNSTLAITETYKEGRVAANRVGKLDTNSGELLWLGEIREGWPTLNQVGELVWIVPEGGNLLINTGESEKTYPIYEDVADFNYLAQCLPLDWYPGNKKILFVTAFSPIRGHILNLDTGSFDQIKLPLIYSPGNWADAQSVWRIYFFTELWSNYSPLVKTNLETGKNQFTGVILPTSEDIIYCSAGKVIAVASIEGIKVYKMP